MALVSLVTSIAIPVVRLAGDPYGVILRLEHEKWPIEKPATSPYSQEYHTDFARLINKILRQSKWAPEDEAWLLVLLGDGWPHDVKPPKFADDQVGYEEHSLYGMAMTILADRIGRGFPITPEVEAATERAVLADLESPFWGIRHAAVASVHNAQWVNRPEFREIYERIARSDPNERVRRNALRRLRYVDGLSAPGNEEPCPTCPSKGG